ncbi:hypothetical protein M2282_000627 [Variovorax boronicumulans]|uniref:hypothetical protein n=1 Tax=Variovorax boronicumulans TaxID=436515 RepID=UPI002476F883|nr:hypothetical protein [Variovorax boronicumulans]MDH6165499.1 hypothetical protein [Variovorax boronicumulans]
MIITDTQEQSPARNADRHAHIVGWGADLDHANRPAYPMERTPPRLPHPVDAPEQQHAHVEVLHSTERPGITRIFGTTLPPSGLSGWLRRHAFRHSENDLRHWMLLLLADRVNVGEGLVEDLSRGHVPNLYAEMGGRAELRHNPMGAARKAAIGVGVLALVALSMKRRRRRLR